MTMTPEFNAAMGRMIFATVAAIEAVNDWRVWLHIYRGPNVSPARALRATRRHARRQRIIAEWRQSGE